MTAAIAAVGAALVLGRDLTFGMTLSADSAHYIAAARTLLNGEGLLRIDGSPLTAWPPLYPLLLAAASLGLFDPVAVAGPLNAIIFGLTIFVVGQYLRQRLQSRFLAVWGCLATALTIPLLELASTALSDLPFILLATLALVWTDRFLTGGGLRALVWAAVFSALAWQTRYIGVAVPVCVGLALLFAPQHKGDSIARRVGQVAVYSLIVAAPMALWLLSNLQTTGSLTSHPQPASYPVSLMLWDVVEILRIWWQHPRCRYPCPSWWPPFAHAALALLAITAALLAPVGCKLIAEQWKRRTVAHWLPFWLFGGFALTYLVLFIASISLLVGIYDIHMARGVSPRFAAPLYIPLLVAGVFALDRILGYAREKGLLGNIGSLPIVRMIAPSRKASVLVAIVTVVLSLAAARQVVPAASTMMAATCGHQHLIFNEPRWVGSETLRYVQGLSIAGDTYSNEPHPLSLHAESGQGVNRYHALATSRSLAVRQLAQRAPDGAYVIWFDDISHIDDYDGDYLRSLPGLALEVELEDGAIFRVTRDDAHRSKP